MSLTNDFVSQFADMFSIGVGNDDNITTTCVSVNRSTVVDDELVRHIPVHARQQSEFFHLGMRILRNAMAEKNVCNAGGARCATDNEKGDFQDSG